MPRTRWQLTNSQEEKYRASVRRLNALGIPTGTLEDLLSKSKTTLRLRQVDPEFATVYELPNSQIAVACAVELTGLKSGVTVCDCELTLPWNTPEEIDVLQNPKTYKEYDLVPPYDGPQSRFLNHWLTDKVALRRGQVVEGLVVAIGSTSIPERYVSGMRVNVMFSIKDQFDNEYQLSINVEVDRTPRQKYLWRRAQRAVPLSKGHRDLFAPEKSPTGDPIDVSARCKHKPNSARTPEQRRVRELYRRKCGDHPLWSDDKTRDRAGLHDGVGRQ